MEKQAKLLFVSNRYQRFSFLKRVCHLPLYGEAAGE